jgi:hypothetical protein
MTRSSLARPNRRWEGVASTHEAQSIGKVDGRDSSSRLATAVLAGRRHHSGQVFVAGGTGTPPIRESDLMPPTVLLALNLGLNVGLFDPDGFDEPFNLTHHLVALDADVRRLAEVRLGEDFELQAVEEAGLIRLVRSRCEVGGVLPVLLESEQGLAERGVQGVVLLGALEAMGTPSTGEEVPLAGEQTDRADSGQLRFPWGWRRGQAELVGPPEEEKGWRGRESRFRDKGQVGVAAIGFWSEGRVVARLAHDSHADFHRAEGGGNL